MDAAADQPPGIGRTGMTSQSHAGRNNRGSRAGMFLRLEAAMGIFLAIMAGGAANAGPNGKDVPRVAFLGFEFINTSLEATAPVEVERIRLLDDVMRQKLTASSSFEIVAAEPRVNGRDEQLFQSA